MGATSSRTRASTGLSEPDSVTTSTSFHETRRGPEPTPLGCTNRTNRTVIDHIVLAGSREARRALAGSVRRMLRMSTLFLRTLREDPADAEVPSHRLLVRAGYIRRAAPGGFTWLPLGWIVYRNVENIVREEMDRAGFQEVHFPALLPREPYEAIGPLGRLRRQHVPAAGPAGQRLPAGADPRGDVHAARQGPVLVVQGPAARASTRSRRSTATRPGRAPGCCAAGSS